MDLLSINAESAFILSSCLPPGNRGVLEFLRETPGVLLVALFAVLGRFSD